MDLFINPANHAPGVKNYPVPGVISSHRLTMGKHKNLLRNHKAQSFQILCVAMYNGPLYKSCQPCPWGLNRSRPRGVRRNIKNLLLNHKAQSFHILYVAMYMYSGPLYKSCQPCPCGQKWSGPRVISSHRLTMGKHKQELAYFVFSNV